MPGKTMDIISKIMQQTSKMLIIVLTFIFALFIFQQSIFGSAVLDDNEHVTFLKDSVWMNLGIILAFVLAAVILKVRSNRKNRSLAVPSDRFLKNITIAYMLLMVLFIVMLQVAPKADQRIALECAEKLLNGDYREWQIGGYCYKYPNQNGIILFFTLIYYIFGAGNWLVLQLMNIPALVACAYFTGKIIYLLFEDKKLARYSYLFLLAFFPMNCYVSFVYGTLFGLAVSVAGLYLVIKYIKSKKLLNGLAGIFLIVLGYGFKSNYLIFFVGTMLVIFYDIIAKRRVRSLAVLAMGILCYIVLGLTISGVVQSATGIQANDGIPNKSWIAMGMQEGSRAPGWYNKYNVNVYKNNNFNQEKTKEAVDAEIAERIKKFTEDKEYAASFFNQKIASQWNEGTFQCFWINLKRKQTIEWSPLFSDIMSIGSDINQAITGICNCFLSFLWLGVLFFLTFDRKKVDVYKLIFAVLFVGGFAFHLFWEAKGQYTLVYVYLMIPYMIRGYQVFLRKCVEFVEKKDKKWSVKNLE